MNSAILVVEYSQPSTADSQEKRPAFHVVSNFQIIVSARPMNVLHHTIRESTSWAKEVAK